MSITDTKFFDELSRRYGVGVMQELADKLDEWKSQEQAHEELHEMEKAVRRFRTLARQAVQGYRAWLTQHSDQIHHPVTGAYIQYEQTYRKMQVRDAYNLYVVVNKDYHELKRTLATRQNNAEATPLNPKQVA